MSSTPVEYAPPVGNNYYCNNKLEGRYSPPVGIDLLCKNLVETVYEQLSEDNIRIFKDRLLDVVGCIFGGAIVPEDAFLTDLFLEWGGKAEAPLFARTGRLPLPAAVMLNSITARANDFGNMFFYIMGDRIPSHCGETLFPLGLTLADVRTTTGQVFIANHVAAENITARILYTLPMRWPTDMKLVSSAAAAMAARYYKLDRDKAKAALSFAATNSTDPANSYYDYCPEFKYHNGESARMGVMAAELAKGGWTGLTDPFFGHWGLVTMQVKDGAPLPALYEKAFEDLGKVYYTEQSFKRWPGGIPTTAAGMCGAALHNRLTEAYGWVDAENVQRVQVFRSNNIRFNYYANPFIRRDHDNALFSYEFSVCCTLLHGSVKVEMVQTPAIQSNDALLNLLDKSTMDTFESEGSQPQMKAVVTMKDGTVFEQIEDYGALMHEYPTKEFLETKFWDQFNAYGKLPKSTGEQIIRLANQVEKLSDMREFTSLLAL